MKLKLYRLKKLEHCTLGVLHVNGTYYCDTLEDTDRGLRDGMALKELLSRKVPGETCIPTGSYQVNAQFWAKHGKTYPLLSNVPGYTGIFIHSGVTDQDTSGCILVGKIDKKNTVPCLVNGFSTMAGLRRVINSAWMKNEDVTIEIVADYGHNVE